MTRENAQTRKTLPSKNKGKGKTPPPRVGSLNTAAGVLREMSRVYRSSRTGKLDAQLMCRYIFALQAMGRLHETVEIERRVAVLEAHTRRPA